MSTGRDKAIANWVWHEEALRALRRTLDILQKAHVPALVVKGMVLAYLLYDDVADRPMSDVDLRVRPRDLWRATRAMAKEGLAAGWTSRQLGAVTFHVGTVLVEFEASVGPPGMSATGVSRLIERSQERVLPGGLRIREPELHDHAVLLVVNAFKDKFFGAMPWSLDDLQAIVERLDVDLFLERVGAAKLRTMTWIVADWMARERSSDAWRGVRERIGASAPRALYARGLRALIERHPSSPLTPALARTASDSVGRRAWALAASAAGIAVNVAATVRR